MLVKAESVNIRTDYNGSPWIKAGKVYPATLEKSGKFQGCYKAQGELGAPFYTRLEHSVHLGGKDWEIVDHE